MNDDYMLEYLMQMGAMRPEEDRLARRQAMVDALREKSQQPLQGQQVGRIYVAPSIAQGIGQLATAYGARKGQEKLDTAYDTFNTNQANALRAMRERMAAKRAGTPGVMPQGGKRADGEDDDMFRSPY
jgi:hypothetical protein